MKKTKILSLALSVLLLASCVLGALVVGAGAKEATVIYTACNYTEDGKEHFGDITAALANAASKSGQWKKDDVLEIRFSGTQSGAGAQDGLLFAQTTIWREDGTKLPITIRGIDTSKTRDALIDLDHAGGWYACANDYTFVNLTMPIGTWGVTLYAGSGNVKFEECYLATTSSRITVHNRAEQLEMFALCNDFTAEVEKRCGVNVIPAADAWEKVVNDPTSPFYSDQYGYLLRAMASKGTLYGDWTHDGDVGGGQYLNACIVFEVLTHTSCLDIDWEPSYGLVNPDMTFKALRQLAHETVKELYGEDYYQETPNDVGSDGEFNVLFPGSSTCYYLADELASLGYHAGLDMNVYNPYISSLEVKLQWEKFKDEAAEYSVRFWKDTGKGATLKTTSNQSIQSVMPLKTWDAAFLYNGSSSFDDFGLDSSKHAANVQNILNDARDTTYGTSQIVGLQNSYDFMKENCHEDTEIFWYDAPAAPIGAFGTSNKELNGYIYADTCTDAVFAGWPELKEGEKVQTSITFGNGVVYEDASTPESRAAILVAASGYHPDETYAKLDASSAKEVKFMESGLGNIPDIRPVDTEATFNIDGENAKVYNIAAKVGSSPCAATVALKKGGVQRISGDNYTSQSKDNGLDGKEEFFYGDLTVKIFGGTVAGSVNTTWDSIVVGNVNLHIEKTGKENINILGNVSGNMGYNTVGRYTGDSVTTIKGANVVGEVKLGGSNQANVYNTIEDSTIGGIFIGSYTNQPVTVTNKLKNVTFLGTGTYYLGSNGDALTNVNNTIENCSFAGPVYGGNKSGYVRGSIENTIKNSTFENKFVAGNCKSSIAGSVTNTIIGGSFGGVYYGGTESAEGRTDTIDGQIKNTITNSIFASSFVGGSKYGSIAGSVTNTITGGSVASSYFGGTESEAGRTDTIGGQIKNTIKGTAFSTGFLYMGNQYASFAANDAYDFRIVNEISGVVAPNSRYFGASSDSTTESVKNTFSGINNLKNSYGGSNTKTVDKIENHYQGQLLAGAFSGCNNANAGEVVNYIKEGAKLTNLYGGLNSINSQVYTLGSVTNYVYGGSVDTIYGAGRGGTVTSVVNYIGDPEGKSAPRIGAFYGGGNDSAVITDVTTTITGGIFEGVIEPGCYKTSSTSKVVNTPVISLTVGKGYLAFLGETTLTSVTGSGVIRVDRDASVTVTGAEEGSIAVSQTEYWQDQTYFTDTTGKLTLSVVDNVPGSAEVLGSTVKGTPSTEPMAIPVAARLVLDARVGVKFYFNKADVTENFTYSVTLGENVLESGTFDDLTEEEKYYVLSFGGIGLSDFMTEFSIKGETIFHTNEESYNTVVKLAELGAANTSAFREKQLFYSIADLGRCAKDPLSAEHNLTYHKVRSSASGKGGEEGALLTFTGKNLLMNDAIGIRLYGTAQNAADMENLSVIVDGADVTRLCDISEAVLEGGKYKFTLDIYISVTKMQNKMNIEILDQNGKSCLTLSDQIDWIAQAILSREPENNLAKQVLIYIQKTNDYITDPHYTITPPEVGNETELGDGVEI